MASEVRPAGIPILANLTRIEVIGDLEENDRNAGRNYFLVISLNGEKFMESEKTSVGALQWEWQDLEILLSPTSLLEIEIYHESSLKLGQFAGRHASEVVEFLDKDSGFLLKGKTGAPIIPHITIRTSLSSKPSYTLEAFVEILKADIPAVSAPVWKTGRAIPALGSSLQVATKIMDDATNVDCILDVSWMLLSVAYKAVKERGMHQFVQDLASMLLEMLGVAQSAPEPFKTSETITIAKEICRVSIRMASLISEYAGLNTTGPIGQSHMSEMQSCVEKYGKSWSDLTQSNKYPLKIGAAPRRIYEDNAPAETSRRGHEELAKPLPNWGADVDAPERYKGNALSVASSRGHEGTVKRLLEQGADVNMQGESGTALVAASRWGHKGVVKLLLEHGADVNAQRGSEGTALSAASKVGRIEVVKLLLENGADVNAQGGSEGNALNAASKWGQKEVLKLLLEKGVDVNVQAGSEGTALSTASKMGHKEVVKLLLENGANVNAQGGPEGNALLSASKWGHKEIVKLLLESGADVNAQRGPEGTALCAASMMGRIEVVKLLLEHGAEVDFQGRSEGNALVAASKWKQQEVVKLLMKKGADENAQGGSEATALVVASGRGYEEISQLLL